MTRVIQIDKIRLESAVKRGFRNWNSKFKEDFGMKSRLPNLTDETLAFLAKGKDTSLFYLYDLIMCLKNLGSGFEFNELNSDDKMMVVDLYLFLLDRIRFECMRRLGWLSSYPGDDLTLVELVIQFDEIGPMLQAGLPELDTSCPGYSAFISLNEFEKEEFIRRLIPEALKQIRDQSKTL
jgi:hypothetical protein